MAESFSTSSASANASEHTEARPRFFDQTPESLKSIITDLKMPGFRANQIMQWVYQRGVADPMQMTNLSQRDRQAVAENLVFLNSEVIQEQHATDGTRKLLVEWHALDRPNKAKTAENQTSQQSSLNVLAPVGSHTDRQTECVMIPSTSSRSGKPRQTACVSSQVGCPVGCKFCASGLGGLDGHLSSGQIIEQIWRLGQLPSGRISNVVFMGMGEPLSNFEQVTAAIHVMMADWGFGISGRRITVSTVGLPAQIRRLAEIDLPITLAISLHAPNDTIRRELIPWAEYVTIDELLAAGRYYFDQTKREITLEYTLLHQVNDQPEHAHELAKLCKKLRANVNLIRYNEVSDLDFKRPLSQDVHQFQEVLRQRNVNVHIRASRGRDIAAACGQLRHENQ